jgi:hypothetical protein
MNGNALGQKPIEEVPSQGIRKVNGKTQEQNQSSSSSTLPNPQPKQANKKKKKQTHTQLPQNPQNSKKKKRGEPRSCEQTHPSSEGVPHLLLKPKKPYIS